MPTYEYHCTDHGHAEIMKPMRDADQQEWCGVCGKPMRRLYSAPRVQNLTASHDSLRSFGRDLRFEGTKTMKQKIAEAQADRRESRAATMGEES